MTRRQKLLKSPTITCHGCGKVVDRKTAFFMYDFECCSISCLEPLRKKHQAENVRETTVLSNGVYKMGGGAYAY